MVASQTLQHNVAGNYVQTNLTSSDRTLVLEQIPGEHTKATSGLVDNRLFKGEGAHNLHAVRDPQFSLWQLKYQAGILPEPLRETWTSFAKLYTAAVAYFAKRGIRIKEVIDNNGPER